MAKAKNTFVEKEETVIVKKQERRITLEMTELEAAYLLMLVGSSIPARPFGEMYTQLYNIFNMDDRAHGTVSLHQEQIMKSTAKFTNDSDRLLEAFMKKNSNYGENK